MDAPSPEVFLKLCHSLLNTLLSYYGLSESTGLFFKLSFSLLHDSTVKCFGVFTDSPSEQAVLNVVAHC